MEVIIVLKWRRGRPPRTTEGPSDRLRLSLSLPCFYAAENAAGVQFITVMYHLLRGKEGVRGGERGAGRRTMPTRRCELDSREGGRANYEMTLATFRLCQISSALSPSLLTTSTFTPNHRAMRFQHFHRVRPSVLLPVRPFSHSLPPSVQH